MSPLTRRELLATAGRGAVAALTIGVPTIVSQPRWARAAAAQTPPTVEAAFVALIAAVNGVEDDAEGVTTVALWVITEFDKALPPLSNGMVSATVAAVLDAYAAQTGGGVTFATTDTAGRLAALEAMVKDPDPAIRQIANQILPFSSFAYWGDVVLGEPARPGGPRPPQWDVAGYLGPSHDRSGSYRDGAPPGFSPTTDFEP